MMPYHSEVAKLVQWLLGLFCLVLFSQAVDALFDLSRLLKCTLPLKDINVEQQMY